MNLVLTLLTWGREGGGQKSLEFSRRHLCIVPNGRDRKREKWEREEGSGRSHSSF